MSPFKKLLKISRPRFWFYIAGPALLGFASQLQNMTPKDIFMLLVFLLPANIFIYGINDYHDFDTDHFNEKKNEKEHRLLESEKNWLKKILIFALLALSIPFFLDFSVLQKAIYFVFIFLSWGYSSPPLRFKARPILDSTSNLFYILPAFFFTQTIQPVLFLWPVAMHLYSAIPDIVPDKKAGLATTATLFGYKNSLLLCFLLWLFFSVYLTIQNPFLVLSAIYPAIPLFLLLKDKPGIDEKIYWYFPYINTILGFLAFWFIVFSR